MHIALVTETFPPEVNGVARTLRRLSCGLTERGHRLELVRPRQPSDHVDWEAPSTLEDDDPSWETRLTAGCPIPFYRGLRFGLPAYHRLKARWRAEPPDVIHIATEGPLGFSALQAARALGLPVCSSFHTNFHQYGSFYGYGRLARVAVRYLRWFHNRTGRTLVPTDEVRALLEAEGFDNLEILSRGVDTELFHPKHRSDELRRSWGVEGDGPVAVYVGRLAPEKDPDLALEAFRRLRAAVPGCRCVVVGDGPSAAEMRRRDELAVFAGMRRGVDLARHYASADFLIFPSRTETFGNVLLEGMASGLPVVSHDYAAARLLMTHGREGYVVPLGDSEGWLQATVDLGALPVAERRAMGRAARDRAAGETWDRIVDRFADHLTDVRGHRRYTTSPPITVTSTRASRISFSGTVSTSFDNTTTSAGLPTSKEPTLSSWKAP